MTDKIKRYSEGFCRQVVSEYEAGASIPDLQKKYGVAGFDTIRRWILKYGRQGLRFETVRIQTVEEANRMRELEKRVKELEQALGKVMLEKMKLEAILEVLEEETGDAAKKNAPASFNNAITKPKTKSDRL